ncbi:MAG: ComEC/Rec2 family competence protein [Rubritalea sp.]|uniref:ComEC/Rec2 family competence protein n=1 Tax=Rubritalea sp. TaxID=2109375 RepID=UPI003242DA24
MSGFRLLENQLARCPLAAPAIAVIAAVLYADQPSWWSALLFLVVVLLGLWSRKGISLVCVIFGCIAGFHHSAQLREQEALVEGYGSWWSGDVWLVSEVERGKALVVSVSDPKVKLRVWLQERDADWKLGQRLKLSGRMIEPVTPLNPQVFDERQWLHRMGVAGVLVSRKCEVVDEISSRFLVQRAAHSVRDGLSQRLTVGLDPDGDESKIIRAMTLGIRPENSTDLLADFRHSGAIHVFAVSGLHVMMVGSMVAVLLKVFGCGRRVWVPCVIGVMFFYAMVTGMRPPAMRASVMGAVLLSAWLVQRKIVLANSVAVGVIVALMSDGHMLFQPGFQLSFGVLVAIVLLGGLVTRCFHWFSYVDPFLPRSLYTRWQEWNLRVRRKVQGALVVASCAWCGSSPLTWMHFRLLAPISIFVSLPLVLLLYCTLISSGVSLVLGFAWLPLGVGVNQWNGHLARSSKSIVSRAALIPGGHVVARAWKNGERVVIYALPDGGASVYLGVGGGAMLDVGSARSFGREVFPSLSQNGARVDSLILSHADSQHCGGVEQLLEMAKLKQCVIPERSAMSSGFKESVRCLEAAGVRVSETQIGARLPLDDDSWIEVVYAANLSVGLADDRCLVLRLHWLGLRVLFISDSGYKFEQWVLENNVDVGADVLVIGNHEGDEQVGKDFIEKVGAKWVVSGNDREANEGANAYTLRRLGALTLERKNGEVSLFSELQGELGRIGK